MVRLNSGNDGLDLTQTSQTHIEGSALLNVLLSRAVGLVAGET